MTPKTVQKPVRWYAQNDKVRIKLQSMGVPRAKIYEAKEGETWNRFTLHRGEVLGVIGGLRAFGRKPAIKQAVTRFHEQGATIVDCETGQNSRDHWVAMFEAATASRRYTPEERQAHAEEMADMRRTKSGALCKRDAYTEWFKKDGRTADEKAEDIGWPRSSLYAEFGPSGAPAGRRPKQPATT